MREHGFQCWQIRVDVAEGGDTHQSQLVPWEIYAEAHTIEDDICERADTLSKRRNDLLSLEAALKALGDTTRLRIAHLLDRGEVCVCHVHEALGLSQPKVSRHLAYLRRAGLVSTRRSGRWIYYRLSPAGMSPLVQRILDATAETLHELALCAIDRRRLAARCDASPKPTTRRRIAR